MAKVEFPKRLKKLLKDSNLQAPTRTLADRVGEILADNKLQFFPNYTDHGIDHINALLNSQVDLVPEHVWNQSKEDSDPRLLYDSDAVVIIGATLLHDIAMHLHPTGFLELVGEDTMFRPLPWFKDNHEDHMADLPWPNLWKDYLREAKRFSDHQLINIIGEESAQTWKFNGLPGDTGQWEHNHYLIIGEFIRRHHARLAHEIAIYGFPGLPVGSGEGQFPAMGTKEDGHPLKLLADLIGLTARSHGTSLRVCKAYLADSTLYSKRPRPMNTAVLYPMALLRVADYLQIDQQRAPAVLFQLRNPPSPISVGEWKKHQTVLHIASADDPRGKMVTVNPELSLPLYLQLKDLLTGLQEELDISTAVLDETYGTRTDLGLHHLNLDIRRVHSNLEAPGFLDSLPYVPNRTGFTADPHLLTLLVEPLYGKQPSVGVRELIQNATDAVRELEAWCKAHNKDINSLGLPEQDGDVVVEFIKRENDTWFLRVRDRGIGMQSDTIQNYFLRAGASFRRSPEWAKEFLDENGQPRVLRAGRFGIGAFAIFLLGPSFKLETRHVESSKGYKIEKATAFNQLIEIQRADNLPIGTTIEVEISPESANALGLESKEYSRFEGPERKVDWYCWDWPKVVSHVISGPNSKVLGQRYTLPISKINHSPEYSVIYPDGFDAIYWTFSDKNENFVLSGQPILSCNGLRVEDPGERFIDIGFSWPEYTQLDRPCIAVLDSAGNLPLTTQRYKLSQETVSFIDELACDVLLSFIAHALVCGPTSPEEALSMSCRHPLQLVPVCWHNRDDLPRSPFSKSRLRWCVTSTGMVPADPWLYTLLYSDSCLVYGALFRDFLTFQEIQSIPPNIMQIVDVTKHVVLPWYASRKDGNSFSMIQSFSKHILDIMAHEGMECLGSIAASRVLASSNLKFLRRSTLDIILGRSNTWTEVNNTHWFNIQNGEMNEPAPLEQILESWEDDVQNKVKHTPFRVDKGHLDLFVAELRIKPTTISPESVIAKLWNECLGSKAIPFDPAARNALIEDASRHPELKRHIEAWQKMKRMDSKWVGPPLDKQFNPVETELD